MIFNKIISTEQHFASFLPQFSTKTNYFPRVVRYFTLPARYRVSYANDLALVIVPCCHWFEKKKCRQKTNAFKKKKITRKSHNAKRNES